MCAGFESRKPPTIRLEPWTLQDLPLLQRLNEPQMTEHLGGPESEERVSNRLQRYVASTRPTSRMFKIVLVRDGSKVGSVGYWERDATAYETGWGVLPEYQGRGIASEAVRMVLDLARTDGLHRYVEAFPSKDNAASNAICRKLSFELVGESDFEYPPGTGHMMRCNEWRIDLWADGVRNSQQQKRYSARDGK